MASKTTTIKISKVIKGRIDHLRVYPKESYDEILARLLEILNICRVNPVRARGKLVIIERQRKLNGLSDQKETKQKPTEASRLSITMPVEVDDDFTSS